MTVVYLSPLIKDLKLPWYNEIEVFDRFVNECFQIHAMLFCIINDFPSYGNLSSSSVRVIEHVKKLHHMSSLNMEGRWCIFSIVDF